MIHSCSNDFAVLHNDRCHNLIITGIPLQQNYVFNRPLMLFPLQAKLPGLALPWNRFCPAVRRRRRLFHFGDRLEMDWVAWGSLD